MTEETPGSLAPQHSLVTQAPVKALDPDGTIVIGVGTAVFVVAAAILASMWTTLAASGGLWRFWVTVAGIGLGVVGMAIGFVRGARRKKRLAANPVPPGDASPGEPSPDASA